MDDRLRIILKLKFSAELKTDPKLNLFKKMETLCLLPLADNNY